MTPRHCKHPRYRLPSLSLTQKEVDELDAFLGSDAAPASLRTLDVVHGFLTAVALSPTEIPQAQWLPLVWSIQPEMPARFADPAQEQRLASYVHWLYDDVLLALGDSDKRFSPLVSRVQSGDGRDHADGTLWSRGFLFGMTLREDLWSAFLEMPAGGCLMLPIFLLGSNLVTDEWKGVVGNFSQRALLTDWIPAVVEVIHVQHFILELMALRETRATLAAAQGRC
ncbi:MAG: yecA family protein [Rhodocyclaceae bacterium]|nr:yecA family protein [Rhodocyclaceae bacterium]